MFVSVMRERAPARPSTSHNMRNYYFFRVQDAFRSCFRKHKPVFFILFGIFILGFVTGLLVNKDIFNSFVFFNASRDLYIIIFDKGTNVFAVFFGRLMSNLVIFAVVTGLSLIVFAFPVHILIFVYRGYVIGAIVSLICAEFGFTGLVVSIIIIIPQALVIQAACNFCVISGLIHCGKHKFLRDYWFNCILFSVLILAAVLFELLVIMLIMRPMHFI